MILPRSDPASLQRCVNVLRAGGLVGMPTETVYGLGADASRETAVAAIFSAKGRPANHPLIVHVADLDGGLSGLAHFAREVPTFAKALVQSFWPGPLTLILPRQIGVAQAAAGGQDSIGLRCPAHPQAQALLRALRQDGGPVVWGVAAPSANRFGRVSPTTAEHVQSELGDAGADGALPIWDGGPCALGIESTIVDCTRGAPVLLRPGSISAQQIEQACGQSLHATRTHQADLGAAPRAPGTLESHYAPRATVRLLDAFALQAALQARSAHAAQQTNAIAVYARTFTPTAEPGLVLRHMPLDAAQTAQALFAVLRELDEQGVSQIWVEAVPATPAWAGVADRLERASAAR